MYSFVRSQEVYNYLKNKFPSRTIVFFKKSKDYIKTTEKRPKRDLFKIKKRKHAMDWIYYLEGL